MMDSKRQVLIDQMHGVFAAKQELADAKLHAQELEELLKQEIVADTYLCHFVMTISYRKLQRALKDWR